jgi:hypothetical protein
VKPLSLCGRFRIHLKISFQYISARTYSITTMSSSSSSFSSDAAAAFGRRSIGTSRPAFNDVAASAFSRGGRPSNDTFAAFGKPPRPENRGFSNDAMSAFGKQPTRSESGGFDTNAFSKTSQNRSGFDSAASAAFGKKPTRRQEEEKRPSMVLPTRANNLGSIMEHFLGPSEPNHTYNGSALTQRRVAAAKVPEPVKMEEMAWPTLSAPKTTGSSKSGMSFADMMKKRVAEEEAQAALKARERAMQESERRQMALDRSSIFIAPMRLPSSNASYSRRMEDDEIIESDLDYVPGDTSGVLPETEEDYNEDEEEDDRAEDQDEYYRR